MGTGERQGMVPVVLGIAGGTALALLLSGLLARFLFEVRPTDPASALRTG